MQMLLDQRARAREIENQMMREIRQQIEKLKDDIDEASRLNELNIVEEVQKDEEKQIREMAFVGEELRKEIEHYDDRARHEEEEIERMGNEKVIIQQDYIDSEQVCFFQKIFKILFYFAHIFISFSKFLLILT